MADVVKCRVVQSGQWQGRALRVGQVIEMPRETAEQYATVGQVVIETPPAPKGGDKPAAKKPA